jgi:hypothetical protein
MCPRSHLQHLFLYLLELLINEVIETEVSGSDVKDLVILLVEIDFF